MQLTDQDLWQIFQVEPVAPSSVWERDRRPMPGRTWIEWAKAEVLSGDVALSRSGLHVERCNVYLARLIRVLDVLAECGIAQVRRHREDGGAMYEGSYLTSLLLNGSEACGCSSASTQHSLWWATHDGFLTEQEVDDWHAGMRSGSGLRTYYGLTFKGKKQAEKASAMPPVCDDESEEMRHDGEAEAAETNETAASMSAEAALRLCRSKPNEAFFYWKSLENGMPTASAVQVEDEADTPCLSQILKDWFERCGHWRDLSLDASAFSSDGVARPDGLQQISEYVRSRRAKVRYVDYDDVHADHVRKASEQDHTQYTWTFLLAGEPQVILRVDDLEVQRSAVEEHYFIKATPSGYSYWIESEEHGFREVCVYFQSGACLGVLCGFGGSIYPQDGIIEGDYELRKVGTTGNGSHVKNANTGDASHTTPPVGKKRPGNETAHSKGAAGDSSAKAIARATAKAAKKTLAPVVKIFEKAVIASTPPHKRKWWQNVRAAYVREPGPLEDEKWRAVAKMVVAGALDENRKPVRDRHSDYLTPLMLRRLIAKLNAPGASRATIEADYAEYLRRRVTNEEAKAAKA